MFLYPLMLLAAGGAAVPILLHLIYRKRAQEVQFSSLRFLHTSLKRTAHRKRLQELLLLAARVGLILLLAAALAKPVLGGAGAGLSKSYTSAILILDDSGSMTCEHNGERRFARAKAAADKALGTLVQGDCAALWFSCRPVPSGAAELTAERAAIRQELTRADCSSARGNLSARIVEAAKVLAGRNDANRELFVITDLQRNSLAPLAAALGGLKDRRVSVLLVDVSDEDYRNAAVADVAVHSRTRAAGEPVSVSAQIRNTSGRQLGTTAALHVDGQKVAEEHFELDAGGPMAANFTCRMAGAGAHSGMVELTADSMAFDNRRFFQTELFKRVPVLVVETPHARVPGAPAAGSYYLLRALNPFGAEGEAGAAGGAIEPRLLTPEAAASADLAGFGAVILSGLERVPPELGSALRSYVAGGGGLIVFPAAGADAAGYEAAFGDRGDGAGRLLPARLGPPLELPKARRGEESEGLELAGLDYSHPALLPFKGISRASSGFGAARVLAGRKLEVPEKKGAQELITMKGALPFLVAGSFGRGRVYLFASPADAEAGNLPVQNVFLPLLHGLVYDLAEGRAHRSEFNIGGLATLAFPDARGLQSMRVTPPDDRTVEVKPSGAENSVSYGPLDEAGVYRYKLLPAGGEGSFVVNPDPEESDLKTMSHAEVARLFEGFRSVAFCSRADEVPPTVARLREGRDLSGLLLAAALALAVFECFFANWMVPGKRGAAGKETALNRQDAKDAKSFG